MTQIFHEAIPLSKRNTFNPLFEKNIYICKKSWEVFAVRFYIISCAGKQYPLQEEFDLLTGMYCKHKEERMKNRPQTFISEKSKTCPV